MDKIEMQKYVQLLQDENEVLNNRVRHLEDKWNYLMSRATEQAYENIKKGCIGLVQITTYEERGEIYELKEQIDKLQAELAKKEETTKDDGDKETMILCHYYRIKGEDYVKASDYDKLISKLVSANQKISELESELSVKENLPKIKNGLCVKKPINEPSAKELSESYTFEELVDLCCRQQTEISRIEELEDRHQSDCITINQLNVALDVMTEKYQRLRETCGL